VNATDVEVFANGIRDFIFCPVIEVTSITESISVITNRAAVDSVMVEMLAPVSKIKLRLSTPLEIGRLANRALCVPF